MLAGATGALGTGNVSVLDTATSLTIQTGVLNAIADTAVLSLAGGGFLNTADIGFASLGAGVNETVGGLVLNGVVQPLGTYGSTLSGATFQNDEYFSGTGVLIVVPEPASAVTLLASLSSPACVASAATPEAKPQASPARNPRSAELKLQLQFGSRRPFSSHWLITGSA